MQPHESAVNLTPCGCAVALINDAAPAERGPTVDQADKHDASLTTTDADALLGVGCTPSSSTTGLYLAESSSLLSRRRRRGGVHRRDGVNVVVSPTVPCRCAARLLAALRGAFPCNRGRSLRPKWL